MSLPRYMLRSVLILEQAFPGLSSNPVFLYSIGIFHAVGANLSAQFHLQIALGRTILPSFNKIQVEMLASWAVLSPRQGTIRSLLLLCDKSRFVDLGDKAGKLLLESKRRDRDLKIR